MEINTKVKIIALSPDCGWYDERHLFEGKIMRVLNITEHNIIRLHFTNLESNIIETELGDIYDNEIGFTLFDAKLEEIKD